MKDDGNTVEEASRLLPNRNRKKPRQDAVSTSEVGSKKPRPDAESDAVDIRITPPSSAISTLDLNYFDRAIPVDQGTGNLPHWTQRGVACFVTFRLADSLPQTRLVELKRKRELWLAAHPYPHGPGEKRKYQHRFVERVERWLDAGTGECILTDPKVREIVINAIQHFAGNRYLLGPWVIMPNHVHVLVSPTGDCHLSDILHSWKSFTAKAINRLQNRSGAIWQKESFDHIIRSPDEYDTKARYIINNPRNLDACLYTMGMSVEEASRLLPDPTQVEEASRLLPDPTHVEEASRLLPDPTHVEEASRLLPDPTHVEEASGLLPGRSFRVKEIGDEYLVVSEASGGTPLLRLASGGTPLLRLASGGTPLLRIE